jgi:hypothetical protein
MEGNIYPLIDQKNLHRTKGRTGEHCPENLQLGHCPINGLDRKLGVSKQKEKKSSSQRTMPKTI